STAVVILAAGLGTRMRSRRAKVLHPLCGRPMLAYVIDAARDVDERPLVVISPASEAARQVFGEAVEWVVQDPPQGTGDALQVAIAAMTGEPDEDVVLSGDTPLLTGATVRRLVERRRTTKAAVALATMTPEDAAGYGRVVRDRGQVARIVEDKDARKAERDIAEVNGGLYAFDGAWLRARIGDLTPSNATGERYLTELVALARADGRRVVPVEIDDEMELAGVNDRVQLATLEADLRWRILERHLLAGVTMQDPTTTFVDAGVELGQDVVLEPNVLLRGQSRIGAESVIGANSRLVDATVGERCLIVASVLESCEVGDDVRIGPFAHLRAGASVGDGAELGNFAEVKQSRVGPRTKQHHFSYIGDADVGADVNIGAGTITANYDGRSKSRTIIGDGAFIGSDSMLIAPVTIGEGAVTGAGSVVTRDVPPGKMAVGVPARIRERRERSSAPSGAGDPADR
ncbi:MAG: bifunctional UDP-N-acetylglucosamine diphosphorylase/glucosamine-1-phosphate N-acetyltransferase GlmU, partial [Candidatus Limnocylindrales bacterium]